MSFQNDRKETADLKKVNAELRGSLARCRELLVDCRSKLTANSNEQDLFSWSEETGEGDTGQASSETRS